MKHKEANKLSYNLKPEFDIEKHSKNTTAFFDIFKTVLNALIIISLFLAFILRPMIVQGRSMNDTLHDKDIVLLTNILYTPNAGDIVVVANGGNLQKRIIKRVVAVENQRVDIDYKNNHVIVDGAILDEPYIMGDTIEEYSPIELPLTVPKGKVFVLGDNREHSLDSRTTDVGLIPVNDIMGKAIAVVFPFENSKFLD